MTNHALTFIDEPTYHGPSWVTGYATRLADARPVMGNEFIPEDLQEFIDCDEACTLSVLGIEDAVDEAYENAVELLKAGEIPVAQFERMVRTVQDEVTQAWHSFWRRHWGLGA